MLISGIEPNAVGGSLILDPRQGACIGVEPDRRQHRDRLPSKTWHLAVM